MYSLIEFPMNSGEKPEVEVAPNIWLEKNDEIWYCFWPQTASTKQIRKAIEKCYLPEKSWTKYKCRILHTYASYDDARKKLADAEFTSTLKTDAELHKHQRPKRNSKKPFRIYSDSSNSENEEISCNKIPSPPRLETTPTINSNILLKTPLITYSHKPSTSTADSSPRFSERVVSSPQRANTFRTTTLTSS